MNHRSSRSEAGFALLEVIVSAAVLAIVAVAVLAGIDGAAEQHGPREVALRRREPRRAGPGADALPAGRLARRLHRDAHRQRRRQQLHGRLQGHSGSATTPAARSAARTTPSRPTTCRSPRRSPTTTSARAPSRSSSRASSAPSVAYSSTRGSLAVQVNNRNGVGVAGPRGQHRRPLERHRDHQRLGLRDLPVHPGRQLQHHAQPPGLGRPLRHHGVGRQPGRHGRHAQRAHDGLRPGRHGRRHHRHLQARLDHHRDREPDRLDGVPRLGHQQRRAGPAARLPADAGHAPPSARSRSTKLFPFEDEYGVFTGGCEEANPASTTRTTSRTTRAPCRRTRAATSAVTVRQPPLNFRVRNASGNTFTNGVTVTMTLRTNTAECIETARTR